MAEPKTSFEAIEAGWFLIRERYDDLRIGANDAQRIKLRGDRDGARDAYYLAQAGRFDEQDQFVKDTKADLVKATKSLEQELQSMQNVVARLKLATSVARLCAALAAMVIL